MPNSTLCAVVTGAVQQGAPGLVGAVYHPIPATGAHVVTCTLFPCTLSPEPCTHLDWALGLGPGPVAVLAEVSGTRPQQGNMVCE